MQTQTMHTFRGLADSSLVRETTLHGRPHVVVPVVALVGNVVVYPAGSDGIGDFVPLSVLSVAPSGWNGRPILPDHPTDGNGPASANEPKLLERWQFGQIFDSRIEDSRLKFNAYLDTAKANAVGKQAQAVVSRCKKGELVEVSIGAQVVAAQQNGYYNGQTYSYVWQQVIPDHLAMLPEGTLGACDLTMGCGAPRNLCRGEVMPENTIAARLTAMSGKAVPAHLQSMLARLGTGNPPPVWSMWEACTEAGFTHAELMGALQQHDRERQQQTEEARQRACMIERILQTPGGIVRPQDVPELAAMSTPDLAYFEAYNRQHGAQYNPEQTSVAGLTLWRNPPQMWTLAEMAEARRRSN